MSYELKIVNAVIVDGSGQPGYTGDIGIKDGKVVALGSAPEESDETIDAQGKVVAPGFVDIHTHYDAQILWDKMLSVSPWHGVTTVVLGNCGFGVAPTRPEHRDYIMRTLEKVEGMSFSVLNEGIGAAWPFESFGEYLDSIEKGGIAINVAVLAGHTPIRMYVMGLDALKREATPVEIEKMKELVADAIGAGAIGFGTSQVPLHFAFDGYPVPSRLATFNEIDELVGASVDAGGSIVQVAAGPTLYIDEMAQLAKKHDVTVSWAALLADSPAPGGHVGALEQNLAVQADGARVVPQVSCRPLQFDFNFRDPYPFGAADAFREAMAGDDSTRRRIYADPAFRDAFRDIAKMTGTLYEDWHDRAVVSYNPADPGAEGKSLAYAASAARKDIVDYVLDASLDTDFAMRVRLDAVNFNEPEVAKLLDHADSRAVIGLSDAGAHSDQLCDACFSTHLLGYWVRDKKVISLERAVKILSSHPAQIFGLHDRGLLAIGKPADIVIFDPETIGASKLKRVNDLPSHGERLVSYSSGIDAVIVNGEILRAKGEDKISQKAALPGQVIRRKELVA